MRHVMTAVGLMLTGLGLNAAEFCATNEQQLANALLAAENNGQNDVIKVAVGNYSGGFVYLGSEDFDLTISGGWSEFFGNPCGQKINPPFDTVLDGNDTEQILAIWAVHDSDITISDLTFINGNAHPVSVGGLYVLSWPNFVGDVLLERTAFINNKGYRFAAVNIDRGRKITVRNNLFVLNESATGEGAVNLENDNALGIYFNNNTVVNNTSLETNGLQYSGLRAVVTGSSGLFVANNLYWNNDGRDALFSVGSAESYLYNNNIDDYFGTMSHEGSNFNAEPTFEPGILNYVPTIASAEINHGRNSPIFVPVPPPFNVQWGTGITDFYGNTRVVDRWVDVGAFEAAAEVPIFKTGFETN